MSSWDAPPIGRPRPALQQLPLSASPSRGLYAEGGLWVFFPPTLFNLLPLIGPHQSWRSCALWGLGPLTLNMWFCGSGHRHLLTHSVEIRHRLQLGISETIVTNKKLVAEWKLCILSQWSCRNITVPDKFLGRILAAVTGAPFFSCWHQLFPHTHTVTETHTHTDTQLCDPGTVMVIYIKHKKHWKKKENIVHKHLIISFFYTLTTASEKIGPKWITRNCLRMGRETIATHNG